MQIVLDTSTASDRDVELLAAFVRVMQGEPAAEQVTNARPKRTRKSATAKALDEGFEQAAAEHAPEPPSEAATQDVEPVSEGAPSVSQKEAVAFVTKQVADGKARRIKMALEKQGVARLSELADDSLGEFMENAQRLCKLSPEEFKAEEAG